LQPAITRRAIEVQAVQNSRALLTSFFVFVIIVIVACLDFAAITASCRALRPAWSVLVLAPQESALGVASVRSNQCVVDHPVDILERHRTLNLSPLIKRAGVESTPSASASFIEAFTTVLSCLAMHAFTSSALRF